MKNKIISRKKFLFYNTIASVCNQLVNILCGFILPRAMLSAYGSEVNGLVSSINQFLAFISFMQMGVGAVVQVAWYKPLEEKDNEEISKVYVSAQKFFRKIAIIFVFYTIAIAIIYPQITSSVYSDGYIGALVFAISVNLFAQYFWGITNTFLLNADQKAYIPLVIQITVAISNLVVCIGLMAFGHTVLVVKLVSSILCSLNPLLLTIYVNKHYNIDKQIQYKEEPIKQKWNGFAQHISAVVVDNTDIIILTLFASLTEVSVYYVYYMVVNAIKLLLMSLSGGIQALLGNMIARNELEKLKKTFLQFEIIYSFITTILYASVMCLIVPFVQVYTYGIDDANYNVPVFAIILTIAYAMFNYRNIYYTLIKAAGHFKETQSGAIIEVIINIVISVVCVVNWGLVGVAIGTLVAISYRTLYCVWYLSKNIIHKELKEFIKNLGINVVVFMACYIVSSMYEMEEMTYIAWFILAIKTTLTNVAICVVLYCCTYYNQLKYIITLILRQIQNRKG